MKTSPGIPDKSARQRTYLSKTTREIDWKRILWMSVGVILFSVVYFSGPWNDAVDPKGEHFALTREGKGALGLFLLTATWWVFEVIPIGVTSITVGVIQALFLLRPPEEGFKDFMDPSVWFIFGSIVIGMVFTKTGFKRNEWRIGCWFWSGNGRV